MLDWYHVSLRCNISFKIIKNNCKIQCLHVAQFCCIQLLLLASILIAIHFLHQITLAYKQIDWNAMLA